MPVGLVSRGSSHPSGPTSSEERRKDLMGAKRQTTMAKLARERKLQERRELKREKKQAAAAAKAAGLAPAMDPVDGDESPVPAD